jgi:hypothetical protein
MNILPFILLPIAGTQPGAEGEGCSPYRSVVWGIKESEWWGMDMEKPLENI